MKILFAFTPLKFYVQSIWRDEAFSYLLAKQNILQILTLTAKDFNPPLYYLLLHGWMGIFGSSEMALRTLSFLFFLATLYVIGLFFIDIFKMNIKQTFLYLFLFAINPVLHYYAFEARMYTLFAFLATLSFYFLYKRSYRKYALTIILGLYTHYFMIFAVIGQLLFILTTERSHLKSHFIMFIKIGLYMLPWILFVLISRPPVNQGFWILPIHLDTVFNAFGLIFIGYENFLGFTFSPLPLLSLSIWGILVYYVYTFLKKKHTMVHDRRMHLFLIGWLIIPTLTILFISFFKPIFLPRYMIFITVGLLITLIFILQRFSVRGKYVCFIVLLAFSLGYGAIQVVVRGKADIKKPLTEIKHMMKPEDVVYVTHEFNFHPAQYYINDRQVYLYGKTYEEIPAFVGKVLIPKDKIVKTLPLFPHRAFILKDDLTYSIQALY